MDFIGGFAKFLGFVVLLVLLLGVVSLTHAADKPHIAPAYDTKTVRKDVEKMMTKMRRPCPKVTALKFKTRRPGAKQVTQVTCADNHNYTVYNDGVSATVKSGHR